MKMDGAVYEEGPDSLICLYRANIRIRQKLA